MIDTKPNISIPVDLTNPGQFFACCGLLELADRLWPGSEGWFDEEPSKFNVACGGTLGLAISCLIKAEALEVKDAYGGLAIKPIVAPLALYLRLEGGERCVVLDSWLLVTAKGGRVEADANPPWNFWSGQQTPVGIWKSLREAVLSKGAQEQLKEGSSFCEDPLSLRLPLTGRFGFDSGAAWHARDLGFSPNAQAMRVLSSPITEMLAVVGIQRFRPQLNDRRDLITYCTWRVPLPPAVAAAAACAVVGAGNLRYEADVVSRGRYSALSTARLKKGDVNE